MGHARARNISESNPLSYKVNETTHASKLCIPLEMEYLSHYSGFINKALRDQKRSGVSSETTIKL